MHHLRPFIFAVFAVTLLLTAAVGCGQQTPEQPSLSDSVVRQFATKYRDDWVATHKSPEADILARSKIAGVTQTPSGWMVRFAIDTSTMKSEIDVHFLNVYIKQTGELDRVETGELVS